MPFFWGCSASGSSLVWKVLQEPSASLLFTPALTPQFSPIENMFGKVKSTMKPFTFSKKEDCVQKICEVMFSFKKIEM